MLLTARANTALAANRACLGKASSRNSHGQFQIGAPKKEMQVNPGRHGMVAWQHEPPACFTNKVARPQCCSPSQTTVSRLGALTDARELEQETKRLTRRWWRLFDTTLLCRTKHPSSSSVLKTHHTCVQKGGLEPKQAWDAHAFDRPRCSCFLPLLPVFSFTGACCFSSCPLLM